MSMPSDLTHNQSSTGRYSDGRTAAQKTVPVGFGPDGLHLVHVDTGETLVWPYAGLSTAQPLAPGNADALLRSANAAGATLFVATPGFVTELILRAPQLTAKAERWRYLKPALGVVVAVAALSGVIWALGWSPSRGIARMIPDRTWQAAGGQLASGFEKDYPGCIDPAGQAALDKLVKRLVDATPDKRPITLHVANWGLVNAFAMPGRHLMLTRGLIRDAVSPEEVAGVMGHEMGHAIELHPEAGLVRQLGLTVGLKLIFAGTSDTLQNVGGVLLLLRNTRIAEREADLRAFELLQAARISAKPLGAFFERMDKKEGGSEIGKIAKAYEILSSHPALDERARNARNRPEYPTEPIMSEAEWQAMRNMCKGPAKGEPPKGSKGPDEKNPPKEKAL
jgi:beta-barrel assembly-enhancing protease